MDERPTIDITLPESGAIVTFYAYMRGGDYRAIQRRLADKIKIKLRKTDQKVEGDVPEVNSSLAYDNQDFAVEVMVKQITKKDGGIITEQAAIMEYIYNLTIADNELVYAKADEFSSGSSLSPEAKKK